jgi:periplasmic protein CpxP/Spy
MKLKLISILAGAVVFVALLSAIAVHAQPQIPSEILPPMMSGITLTPEQETQLQQVRSQTQNQIESILTPEQRDRARAALEQGEGIQRTIASMDLTKEQQTQLRTVFQSARQQMAHIITPQQRRQILQNIRSLRMQSNQ